MKKVLCFILACIILLANTNSVLAAKGKSLNKNGKAFGALLKDASAKVGDIRVVKFKYDYRPFSSTTEDKGIVSVNSVVILDFNKYTAKMKSIVRYKDRNGNVRKAKVLCKKDMQIDDCVFKFEEEIKNNSKLKSTIEEVLSGEVFRLFSTSNFLNVGEFIFYPWQHGTYLYDAKYTKKANGYQSVFQNGLRMEGRLTLYIWMMTMTFMIIALFKRINLRNDFRNSLILSFNKFM